MWPVPEWTQATENNNKYRVGTYDLSYLLHVGDIETCWSASELQHPFKELISSSKVIIKELVSTPALWSILSYVLAQYLTLTVGRVWGGEHIEIKSYIEEHRKE